MKTEIAFFVYNRPEHTRRVLQGLAKNNINQLYIFSDGPKDKEQVPYVQEVRKIIKAIDWCDTELHISEVNKGCADSVVEGINYVLKKHERIIVLEDDCILASGFVAFMEQLLDRYEANQRVMCINGFQWPISIPASYKYDLYFWTRSSPWGWGTWRRAWQYYDRKDEMLLNKITSSERLICKVNQAGKDLIPLLKRQVKGQLDTWDIQWFINIVINDGVCVKPVKSLIQNIGFDGTGVHCGKSHIFDVELNEDGFNEKRLNFPPKIFFDQRIISQCRYIFNNRGCALERMTNKPKDETDDKKI